jgi:hypothetical protein
MQLDLTILTKQKKMIRCYESFRYDSKTLSTDVTNDLTQVNIPVEDR